MLYNFENGCLQILCRNIGITRITGMYMKDAP